MVNRESLRSFVESKALAALSEEMCRVTGSNLFPGYPDVIFESLVKRLDAANISVDDLEAVVSQDRDPFFRYAKRAILAANLEDIDQEFPPGYDPEPDDFSKLKKNLGVSKDFLVRHMTDYLVLSKNQSRLEDYLVTTKTPNARKQAERLRALYRGSI